MSSHKNEACFPVRLFNKAVMCCSLSACGWCVGFFGGWLGFVFSFKHDHMLDSLAKLG